MAGEYFEILKSTNDQDYWHLKASNGAKLGWSGETYVNKSYAISQAERVRNLSSSTPIKDATGER